MDTSKFKDTQEDIEKICSDEYYKDYINCMKGTERVPKSLDETEKSCREKHLGLKKLEKEKEDIDLRGDI